LREWAQATLEAGVVLDKLLALCEKAPINLRELRGCPSVGMASRCSIRGFRENRCAEAPRFRFLSTESKNVLVGLIVAQHHFLEEIARHRIR